MARKRATAEEKELRINEAIALLRSGYHKWEIKRYFNTKYGVKWRQSERYLRHARERLLEMVGEPVEELRAKSLAWYLAHLRREDIPIRVRLEMRKAADRLLGLAMPQRIAIEGIGTDGRTVEEWSDSELDELIRTVKEYVESDKRKRHRKRTAKRSRTARSDCPPGEGSESSKSS